MTEFSALKDKLKCSQVIFFSSVIKVTYTEVTYTKTVKTIKLQDLHTPPCQLISFRSLKRVEFLLMTGRLPVFVSLDINYRQKVINCSVLDHKSTMNRTASKSRSSQVVHSISIRSLIYFIQQMSISRWQTVLILFQFFPRLHSYTFTYLIFYLSFQFLFTTMQLIFNQFWHGEFTNLVNLIRIVGNLYQAWPQMS